MSLLAELSFSHAKHPALFNTRYPGDLHFVLCKRDLISIRCDKWQHFCDPILQTFNHATSRIYYLAGGSIVNARDGCSSAALIGSIVLSPSPGLFRANCQKLFKKQHQISCLSLVAALSKVRRQNLTDICFHGYMPQYMRRNRRAARSNRQVARRAGNTRGSMRRPVWGDALKY
jgi:hypothetical protein